MSADANLFEGLREGAEIELDDTQTVYNGSKVCKCGAMLNPVQAMYSSACPQCMSRQAARQVKGMMP